MPRLQSENIFEQRLFGRNGIKAKVSSQDFFVQLLLKIRMIQECFDLRCKQQAVFCLIIIERLDAPFIPCQEKAFFLRVPNGECIHAAQFFRQRAAPFLITMYQDFCICLCLEAMSFFLQFLPKCLEVINLAVKDNDDRFVFVIDWLVPCLQIDNRQAPMSQAAFIVHKKAFPIRPAMCDPFGHGFQYSRLYFIFTDIACNSAHFLTFSGQFFCLPFMVLGSA